MTNKNAEISLRIARLVSAGASVQAAVDEVLGAGTYAKLAADLYDGLNARAAATATRQ